MSTPASTSTHAGPGSGRLPDAGESPWAGRRTGVRLAAAIAMTVAIAAVLLGVFSLYTQPDFLVTLADQLWACF